jgi:Ca2+-binding EF-hand superfamily protein
MKKLILLSGAALILSSSLAMAGNGKNAQRNFESFDTNHDGIITSAESAARAAKNFTKIDLDNNGEITKAEFENRIIKNGNKSGKKRQNTNNSNTNIEIKTAYKYDPENGPGRNSDQ